MRWGISTDFAGLGGTLGFLPFFREIGLDALEIFVYRPSLDSHNLKSVEEYSRIVQAHGVEILSYHLPYREDISVLDVALRLKAMNENKQGIKAAKIMGARYAVVHPGMPPKGESLTEKTKQSVESLRELNQVCFDQGIQLVVENMLPRHVGAGAEALAELLTQLPTEMGICLDTGHAFIADGTLQKAMELLGPRIMTLHVHDNDGVQDLHRVPGEGKIVWDELTNGLVKYKFKGVLMLELNPIENPYELLRAAQASAARLVREINKKETL